MEIKGLNFDTEEDVTFETDDIKPSFWDTLIDATQSDAKLRAFIDSLNCSADLKEYYYRIASVTIRVGKRIIQIGRKILETVMAIAKEYPHTSFGFCVGFLIGALAGEIPLFGVILGPALGPLAMLLGVVNGYFRDNEDSKLTNKIKSVVDEYAPLAS